MPPENKRSTDVIDGSTFGSGINGMGMPPVFIALTALPLSHLGVLAKDREAQDFPIEPVS